MNGSLDRKARLKFLPKMVQVVSEWFSGQESTAEVSGQDDPGRQSVNGSLDRKAQLKFLPKMIQVVSEWLSGQESTAEVSGQDDPGSQ